MPEWVQQEAILLAWPDAETDWARWLPDVQSTYTSIIQELNRNGTGVILLCRPTELAKVKSQLRQASKVLLLAADYNDTWIRDYGFLTCTTSTGNVPVNFQFNGWGNKFEAGKDNKVNEKYLAKLCQQPMHCFDTVLEGGALEINAQGHVLSTQMCLLNPERNGDIDLVAYRQLFQNALGASRTSLFQHGHLQGDDTDGHIDTLVRFTPDNSLVVQTAYNRRQDSHYQDLQLLLQECQEAFPDAHIFELALPSIYSDEGDRLPASYANYLICNQVIYAPVYKQPEDTANLKTLRSAYPGFQVLAIDCSALIQQYGSLHCISMQVPTNTLKPDVIEQLEKGVSIYGQ